jgi:aspartate--ammonia ligase
VPNNLFIPTAYQPTLGLRAIESAIKDIKDYFERCLAEALNLQRVTAPLFVRSGTGINDDLNGVERPLRFCVKEDGDAPVEIVQSLAKWKRLALARYGFRPGEGLYTDMNAIRPDETLDHTHSIYVDQWDWEKVLRPSERNLAMLKTTVDAIYDAICRTEFHLASEHSSIRPILPERITFITAEELCARYPDLHPRQREDRICAERKAVFVIGIGGVLPDGQLHDGRAPDYDDWTTPNSDGGRGLNGDILLWHPVLEKSFEVSSMGIRVDPATLLTQLEIRQLTARRELPFHRQLLAGELPQTMGGGIGQSRLCMFFLRCAHVGEVACGIWPDEMVRRCKEANITLL